MSKPESIAQYMAWLKKEFGMDSRDLLRSRYDAASSKAFFDVEASPVWQTLLTQAREFNDAYRIETGYKLLVTDDPPKLVRKEFQSAFIKSFRQNVLANDRWPDPPSDGWRLPPAWLHQINDIVRTVFVVKYLDGVTYLADRIMEVATDAGLYSRVDFEAKPEGYYAAHVYISLPVEVPKVNWDTEQVTLQVEVQITTQLQEVIRRLTHEHYEVRRIRPTEPKLTWQWDYRAEEFTPNYLGHILHYVEGMIMEVRDRSANKETRESNGP